MLSFYVLTQRRYDFLRCIPKFPKGNLLNAFYKPVLRIMLFNSSRPLQILKLSLISIKRLKKFSPLLYSQFQFTNNITRGGDSFTFARQEEEL